MMRKKVLLCAILSLLILSASPLSVSAMSKTEYKELGLLPYKGEPYFTLGKLDKYGCPTWVHIQLNDFIGAEAAKHYQNPKKTINGNSGALTDYLTGFHSNEESYLVSKDSSSKVNAHVWKPRYLLNVMWVNGVNSSVIQNFGLITTYANEGYTDADKDTLVSLEDYDKALSDWTSSFSSDWDSKN